MSSHDRNKKNETGSDEDRIVETSMKRSHRGGDGEAGHAAKQQLRHDKDLNKAYPEVCSIEDQTNARVGKTILEKGE